MVNEAIPKEEEKKAQDNDAVCNRCGDCCRTLHLRIPVADEINPEMLRKNMMLYWNMHEGVNSELQRDSDGKLFIIMTIQTVCSMLLVHADTTCTCKIYNMRPPICRNWPFDTAQFRGRDIPMCSMLLDPVTGKHEDKLDKPVAWLKDQDAKRGDV